MVYKYTFSRHFLILHMYIKTMFRHPYENGLGKKENNIILCNGLERYVSVWN